MAVNAGERRMQRRRPGRAALGPAGGEVSRDSVEIADAAALQQDKGGGTEGGDRKAEENRYQLPHDSLSTQTPSN